MENRIYAKKKRIEGQEREKIKINEAIIHIRMCLLRDPVKRMVAKKFNRQIAFFEPIFTLFPPRIYRPKSLKVIL